MILGPHSCVTQIGLSDLSVGQVCDLLGFDIERLVVLLVDSEFIKLTCEPFVHEHRCWSPFMLQLKIYKSVCGGTLLWIRSTYLEDEV